MALRLEITSNHKDFLGEDHVRVFRQNGGTIGRSLQNDWILPDPDKYISGKHATIDRRAGSFYLADVSTNGVYVNGADEPLGKGNPRRLFDGDMLRMGDVEMLVHVDEGEDLDVPEQAEVPVAADYIEQQASDDHNRSSIMLLDEEELTGDEEFQAALFGAAAPPEPEAPLLDESARIGFDFDDDDAALFEAGLNDGASTDLFNVFLTALGIKRADIHPSIDPAEVMANAGQIMRELVRGTTDLLVSRANVKSMFRLDQTTVMPRHNNPLKLSTGTSESIKQLLVGQDGEYLGPLDSVKEVCRDLKFHHDAVLGGMTKAFGEFIDRFDPDELQDSFDKTLDRKPLFDALNKVKYWQLYCDLYPIITQRGSGTLPQQFSEEFVREYERSIAEFKRLERGLRDTQKLEPGAIPAAAEPSNDPLGPDDELDFEITEVLEEMPDSEAQA